MRRAFVPFALAAGLLASVAGAQLSQTFKDFPNGPAGFVMTDNEKKAFAQLKSDSEAQAWIELFWAKRDPDLNTVENEFKQDFDLRVTAADKMFSAEKLKGSMSDRGKVLILMGKPLSLQNVAAGAADEEGNRPSLVERVRLNFGHRVTNQHGKLILEAETFHACTGIDEKPKRLPEELAEKLGAASSGPIRQRMRQPAAPSIPTGPAST